ncbi:glycine receptor subunit alpha-2-like protein, partial [Leptotrombidium deliense]
MSSQLCQPLSTSSLIVAVSYPSNVIEYMWDGHIEVSEGIKVPLYQLHHVEKGSRMQMTLDGNFSFVYINISFERQVIPQLIHTYSPSTLLVVISWFSFWIGLDAIPARITLSVTSLLALVTHFAALRKELPPIDYINGSDLWMIMCMMFVFASLLQFSIVNFINARHNKKITNMINIANVLFAKEKLPFVSFVNVGKNWNFNRKYVVK